MANPLEFSHTSEAIRLRLAHGARVNYLRDWIYGSINGGVTTFAIVAGVVGTELPSAVVLLLGFANLVADGFAMAASNYSGTKAERDDYKRVLDIEREHISLVPEGEREEIRQIFANKGFAGDDLERIVQRISRDPVLWANTMAVEEYGLSPTMRSSAKAALVTFVAFILCGAIRSSHSSPLAASPHARRQPARPFSAWAPSRAAGRRSPGGNPDLKPSLSE
jgi:hypothetical protein